MYDPLDSVINYVMLCREYATASADMAYWEGARAAIKATKTAISTAKQDGLI